jgi:hypothetical protein
MIFIIFSFKMGLSLSIQENSVENVSNQISQLSNEYCINFCTNDTSITLNIDNSEIGNIKIDTACFVDSASCNLKSSLDSTLINSLSNFQKGDITDLSGPFTFLDALARIGGGDNIDLNNYQNISNESTQQMNSICQTNATSTGPILINLDNDKVENLIVDKKAGISKSNCVIDNMSKFYAQNSEKNSQVATITRAGILAILALIIAIAIVIKLLTHHSSHNNNDKQDMGEELLATEGGGANNNDSNQVLINTLLKN